MHRGALHRTSRLPRWRSASDVETFSGGLQVIHPAAGARALPAGQAHALATACRVIRGPDGRDSAEARPSPCLQDAQEICQCVGLGPPTLARTSIISITCAMTIDTPLGMW